MNKYKCFECWTLTFDHTLVLSFLCYDALKSRLKIYSLNYCKNDKFSLIVICVMHMLFESREIKSCSFKLSTINIENAWALFCYCILSCSLF